MDFNGVLTADEVREVETAVNEVIVKKLPVEITYPSKEDVYKRQVIHGLPYFSFTAFAM